MDFSSSIFVRYCAICYRLRDTNVKVDQSSLFCAFYPDAELARHLLRSAFIFVMRLICL